MKFFALAYHQFCKTLEATTTSTWPIDVALDAITFSHGNNICASKTTSRNKCTIFLELMVKAMDRSPKDFYPLALFYELRTL